MSSKCQMRKYLPGGRCGGTLESIKKEDKQGVNNSFNNLLAQRDAQMAQMWEKPKPETQIVLVQEKKQPSKEQLINTILNGDYE